MIYINDDAYPIEHPLSVSALFGSLDLALSKGVALAVNNQVIPRSNWDQHTVAPGDRIILIKATQGG